MPVYVCVHVHAYSMCVQVCEEQETTLLFCLRHHSPYSGDGVSYWPEACQLGHSDWPVNLRHPPVSTFPGLGLQVCTTTPSLYHRT